MTAEKSTSQRVTVARVAKGLGLALGVAAAVFVLWFLGAFRDSGLPDDLGQSISQAPGP